MTDTMHDAHGLMRKLEELDAQIAKCHATIRDLEGQQTVAMAEQFLQGDHVAEIDALRHQLAAKQTDLSRLEAIRPVVVDTLQAARQVLRRTRETAYTETITKAVARQEEIKRQIAALNAQRLLLLCEFGEVENEMIAAIGERSRLQQARDAWSGTLEALQTMAHDPEAPIRPDEIGRVLDEWRAQEQQEGCKINHVELTFETATGTITHAKINTLQTKEELRELALIRQEREARQAAQAQR